MNHADPFLEMTSIGATLMRDGEVCVLTPGKHWLDVPKREWITVAQAQGRGFAIVTDSDVMRGRARPKAQTRDSI